MSMSREVILVPGLWMPGAAMSWLGARLTRAGMHCRSFDYSGRERPLAALAERLARFARESGPAAYLGHSLGGLVVLEALVTERSLEVGAVVLLGTPVQGSIAGRRLARARIGHWMLGKSEPLWREGRVARWTRPEPLGVIAGTVPIGLGRALGRLPGANDGVVRVEETEVEGMHERLLLPVSHSAMLLSSRVAAQCVAFLQRGSFDARAH
jgi:pimeloyl-ACP methyl ester carboxylesterase